MSITTGLNTKATHQNIVSEPGSKTRQNSDEKIHVVQDS